MTRREDKLVNKVQPFFASKQPKHTANNLKDEDNNEALARLSIHEEADEPSKRL